MLQHLVFSCKHLSFGLIKGALIASTKSPVTALGTNRCRSQTRRGSTARRSRPAVEVGTRHVDGGAVMEDGRAWVGPDRRGWNWALGTGGCRPIRDGTTIFGTVAIVGIAGLEALEFKLLLTDHNQQAVLRSNGVSTRMDSRGQRTGDLPHEPPARTRALDEVRRGWGLCDAVAYSSTASQTVVRPSRPELGRTGR